MCRVLTYFHFNQSVKQLGRSRKHCYCYGCDRKSSMKSPLLKILGRHHCSTVYLLVLKFLDLFIVILIKYYMVLSVRNLTESLFIRRDKISMVIVLSSVWQNLKLYYFTTVVKTTGMERLQRSTHTLIHIDKGGHAPKVKSSANKGDPPGPTNKSSLLSIISLLF